MKRPHGNGNEICSTLQIGGYSLRHGISVAISCLRLGKGLPRPLNSSPRPAQVSYSERSFESFGVDVATSLSRLTAPSLKTFNDFKGTKCRSL